MTTERTESGAGRKRTTLFDVLWVLGVIVIAVLAFLVAFLVAGDAMICYDSTPQNGVPCD